MENRKQLIRLVRHAVVDPYLAAPQGRAWWVCRLQKSTSKSSTPSVRRKSFKYILDSGLEDEITNGDVLDYAEKRDPDMIIPNDEVNTDDSTTAEDAIEQTADRVEDFLDRVTERDLNAKVLIPLQPPYDKHYKHLLENYPRQARRRHFALGGVKNEDPITQIKEVYKFRQAVGWDAYAHGFGMGVSKQMILELRKNPGLLDSIDASTVGQHARNGKIAGNSRVPIYVGYAQGDDSVTTAAHYMMAEMADITRMLAPNLTPIEKLKTDWEKLPARKPESHIEYEETNTVNTTDESPTQKQITSF